MKDENKVNATEETKEEVKTVKKSGVRLTDGQMAQVAGGKESFAESESSSPFFSAFSAGINPDVK